MSERPAFMAHKAGDDVAVAVRDISPGLRAVANLETSDIDQVDVTAEIPLGHKVALNDVAEGQPVIEYGLPIGVATADIARGAYVHTQNLRSAKWQNSTI